MNKLYYLHNTYMVSREPIGWYKPTRSTCEQRLCSAQQNAWVYHLERSGHDHGARREWDLLADTAAQLPEPQFGFAPASYLLQPSSLLLLLLDPLLPLGQQLPLVLLVLPLLLLQLLPAQCLRALLVGQLQPQEVPAQRGLTRQVQDGAAQEKSTTEGPTHIPWPCTPQHLGTPPCSHSRNGEKGWVTSVGADRCQVEHEFHTISPHHPFLFFSK